MNDITREAGETDSLDESLVGGFQGGDKPATRRRSAERSSSRALAMLPRRFTYAALVDRFNRETEISEFMVRRALEEVEEQQQFPFAPVPASPR